MRQYVVGSTLAVGHRDGAVRDSTVNYLEARAVSDFLKGGSIWFALLLLSHSPHLRKDHTMPGLTVAEKNHWKDRLSKRIDRRIETIAAEEPNLLDRVKRDARERAMQSLNVAELQADVDAIEQQEETLDKRKGLLHRTMLARVRRVPLETIDQHYAPSHYNNEVENAVKSRQVIHEDELLAACEIGQRILVLRRERESLLDVIWLSTSPVQIREIWSKMSELLGDEQTQLHRDALKTTPVQD